MADSEQFNTIVMYKYAPIRGSSVIWNAYNLLGAHTITSFVLLETGFGIEGC